ncbi:hypothetical protein IX317_000258 [Fusobacterium sp. DD29]|uniref:restriction endonuclease subunit S n=1 Tax=unclassified Fusobacterium TaxID=2648384 RepID=UPI001B8C1487|nr:MULTISPECIES: restriction endonuclease subunit S [unclassified Fusobacterium]MBR8748599.1 hypothetical protein [Fusobacterium sp. DD29]MBR8760866.1 hypothetical protein [Fusobacterium sp. DD25]MBR8766878.1 hypothetical protein [Fusobacterium sp. DD43]MBR8770879.1 hypothetical protein [Fusobacterium sp. DD40]MBR8775107.1 hypothetical protein [Fusobacterium sp. DD17]
MIINLHDNQRIPLSSKTRNLMTKKYPYYGAASIMDYVENYIFDGTYLLLGEDGTVSDSNGYPILQYVYGKFWVNNHAHVISGKNGFSVEILYLLFKNINITSIITGAVQQKINQQNLKKLKILIPDKNSLENINKIIQPIFKYIRLINIENKRLQQIKKIILPKLLSGEIDISNIELGELL